MNVLAAYLAILVIAASGAFVKGCTYGEKEAEGKLDALKSEIAQAHERRQREVSEWVIEASRRSEEAARKLAERQVEIQTVTREIVREVPVYVTEAADARNCLTRGWVRVHDAAATGTPLPETPGFPVDEASTVKASFAAEVIAENYARYQSCKAQVDGWQEWYETEKGKWNGGPS